MTATFVTQSTIQRYRGIFLTAVYNTAPGSQSDGKSALSSTACRTKSQAHCKTTAEGEKSSVYCVLLRRLGRGILQGKGRTEAAAGRSVSGQNVLLLADNASTSTMLHWWTSDKQNTTTDWLTDWCSVFDEHDSSALAMTAV